MYGLRRKSIRVYVTLCFVLVTLCAAGEKEGDPKDVPTDGVYPKEGDPKDVPTDDVKDTDHKDEDKEDVKAKISNLLEKKDIPIKDQVTDLLQSLSTEDIAKLENMTEEEAEKKVAFLSPEEGCDFLGVGRLFDRPDYHKDLLMDYLTMERFGYWELRCEEFSIKDPAHPYDMDITTQRPSYCT